MKSKALLLWLATTIFIVVGIFVFIISRPKSPFTDAIRRQTNFIIFYPNSKTTGYTIDPDTIKYDNSAKGLIFTLRKSGNSLVITEQTTPDPFNDISQYWDAFTTKLNVYSSFDSVDGKVALTHPTELKGGQSAVFNGKGTLMFVHPIKNLSLDQWKQFFNNLDINK